MKLNFQNELAQELHNVIGSINIRIDQAKVRISELKESPNSKTILLNQHRQIKKTNNNFKKMNKTFKKYGIM